jgi:hypothetical protein
MDPESGRRTVADKEAQIGTGNVAGITFGVDKWKYPYNATVEHTMEFNRRKNGGFGVTSVWKTYNILKLMFQGCC